MTTQQSELNKDSFSVGNNSGSSPQHETRYFSSKRAREIQAEEGITSAYRSGALPPPSFSTNGAFNNGTLLSDSAAATSLEFLNLKSVGAKASTSNGSSSDHTSYPSSFRRTRADTLPSSLSRPPIIHGHSPSSSLSMSSSSATNLLTPPKANSRIRSGSLTLPSSSLSAAFGPSIFTSGWSDHRSESNGPPTPPMQTPTTGDLLRGDENNTVSKTLDYLGLDDHEHGGSGMSKISTSSGNLPQIKVEMKNHATSYTSSGGSIPNIPALRRDANRIRSYSVSATAKYDEPPVTTTMTTNNLFPPGSAAVQQFHQTHSRPRAISLGILDLPNDITVMRQGRNSQMYNDLPDSNQGMGTGNSSRSLGGEQLLGMMLVGAMESKKKQQQAIHDDDYMLADHDDMEIPRSGISSPRDHTPDHSQQSTPPPQTPTRSLWIGNIDPNLSNQDLMQLFSPYGTIESLRLLPDKECGFVNFVRVEDAIRAKDDIMNRMGGRVGNCIVRVGYGKADALNNHDLSPSSQTQLQPTRALWVGNIPTSTTPQTLQNIFSPYGSIESARVLTHKNCGFVNFEKLDDAIKAKKALHGKEVLGSAVGPVRIGFAKVQPKPSPTSTPEPGSPATRHIRNLSSSSSSSNNQNSGQWNGQIENYHNSMMRIMIAGATNATNGLTEKQLMMRELSGGVDDDIDDILAENRSSATYFTSIPPVGDPNPNRKPDASRLREIRKRLDSGHCTAKEVEAIAAEVLDECVELSSDYIGNTVIQKLFERCSENTKTKMLEKIAPHLATIGIHKNGTWAAQKIIDCAKTPAQMQLITSNVKAYTPPLLLDQFGNYVVQCCLRLSSQRNQFIFDAMVDRCLDIAQGRFGARAMRACLESQHVTKKQQKQVAIAIVMNAVPLSTNPNGALLLTWMLDTSSFPGRYRVLAPRLAPHLAHLCTHKLASLTVLKIVNQRQEADARDLTIAALFFSTNDQVLEDVLSDQVHGVGVVQKVLASPYVDHSEKTRLSEKVKYVLGKLKVQQVQGYKRLLEELGMVGDPSLGSTPLNSGPSQVGIPPQGVFPSPLPDFAAAAAYYAAAQAAFANQQLQQVASGTPSSENNNSSPHEQLGSQSSIHPTSSEGSSSNSTSTASTTMASTPSSAYPPTPMFMNNMPMSPHPHSPFPPTSPYPHMSPFPPFIHPSTLAAVAGMYHPAMFSPAAAYPYMLAASSAMPPPMMNTAPPTPGNAGMPSAQMLAFIQQQQQLLQQQTSQQSQQQQSQEQSSQQQQQSPSIGSDAQAQSSPQIIAESLTQSTVSQVSQVEVPVQAQQ